ncbi:MAG: SAM-dependent methyltransferase [bacterium]|nr:SAM-dependent methyltransferase [bacterium]
MYRALYAPGTGYYTSGKTRIGRTGDYTTASEIPAFGECIARWIWRRKKEMGKSEDFTIVELGAGDGSLARTILEYFGKEYEWSPRYIAVDVRPHSKEPGIRWMTSQEFKKEFGADKQLTGVVISNEFFDALPVHRIIQKDRELQEIYVQSGQEYAENISDECIASHWDSYGADLLEGQQAEVSLEALVWMEKIAQMLRRGFVLSIDYGDTAERLYAPYRSGGTVMGYHNHMTTDSVYDRVGEQDITAHVNFTALINYGEKFGLEKLSFTTQAEFLLENGIMNTASKEDSLEALNSRQAMKRLLLPGGFGEEFKVLVQKKI